MEDYIKKGIGIILGLWGGAISLQHDAVTKIAEINPQAFIDLSIACFKAAALAGSGWATTTFMAYMRRKIMKWWKQK